MKQEALGKNNYYGTGRRKTSVAKVWLRPGEGKFTINGISFDEYLKRKTLEILVHYPLVVTATAGKFNVLAETKGGGVASQAGAIRHGIARALVSMNPEFRVILKREGFLTRDPRMKERKKYGHKRARKSFQYTKR